MTRLSGWNAAAKLEQSGRDGDIKALQEHTSQFVRSCRALGEVLDKTIPKDL